MTTTERAVRKASRERLLRDFADAAEWVAYFQRGYPWVKDTPAEATLRVARSESSRTRYACLMTAFGQ